MKVIIAGSRNINSLSEIRHAIESSEYNITEIISGGARGVDQLGELYALQEHIKMKRFPANWDLYGKSAGYKRNEQMAEYADALIAIWDGDSKGTKHMIDIMRMKNKANFVYIPGKYNSDIF